MKILARSIIKFAKAKQAARQERLYNQAAADAYAAVTSYQQESSQR